MRPLFSFQFASGSRCALPFNVSFYTCILAFFFNFFFLFTTLWRHSFALEQIKRGTDTSTVSSTTFEIKENRMNRFQCEIEPREKGHWMNCQAWQRQREQRFQPVKMKRIVASAKSRSETMELVNRIALGTQPAKIGSIFRQFFSFKKKLSD